MSNEQCSWEVVPWETCFHSLSQATAELSANNNNYKKLKLSPLIVRVCRWHYVTVCDILAEMVYLHVDVFRTGTHLRKARHL